MNVAARKRALPLLHAPEDVVGRVWDVHSKRFRGLRKSRRFVNALKNEIWRGRFFADYTLF